LALGIRQGVHQGVHQGVRQTRFDVSLRSKETTLFCKGITTFTWILREIATQDGEFLKGGFSQKLATIMLSQWYL
jgi:hypothetical protein